MKQSRISSDKNPLSGWSRRALWTVHVCLVPALMVFFLCPCGTIYNSKAPHGVREASWVADVVASTVGFAVVMPVAIVAEGVSTKVSASKADEETKDGEETKGDGKGKGKEGVKPEPKKGQLQRPMPKQRS